MTCPHTTIRPIVIVQLPAGDDNPLMRRISVAANCEECGAEFEVVRTEVKEARTAGGSEGGWEGELDGAQVTS